MRQFVIDDNLAGISAWRLRACSTLVEPTGGEATQTVVPHDRRDETVVSGRASEPASLRPFELHRGSVIGRYTVLSRLGSGGMGVVFAAYDPELDRRVAIKLLKSYGVRPNDPARLQREAQALAKLDHRNVVSVYDVGRSEGQVFVAMEFVRGQTLGRWMRDAGPAPRPWREVIRVFTEAGRGLQAVHEAGLIHRDFKPDNVMMGDDGRVRVMDFGLARPVDSAGEDAATSTDAAGSEGSLTQTGALLGTPVYMAPEQLRGAAADARSDQFGFCVALYEALYGERPFAPTTISELKVAMAKGQLRDSPRGSSVPPWLRKQVLRGLAVRPSDRFASMRELLAALARDPRRSRQRGAALVGIVAAIAAAGWAVVTGERQTEAACEGFEAELVGIWDDTRREQLRQAFAGSSLSYGASTWPVVERGLDDYAGAWLEMRESACRATRRGTQSEALLDLRMACLDDRLRALSAAVEALAPASDVAVDRAASAVAGLPALSRCADSEALLAEVPPPEDPLVAARLPEFEDALATARAQLDTGQISAGLATVEAIVDDVEALGYEPLIGLTWQQIGNLRLLSGDLERSEAALERAYTTLLAARMLDEAAAVAAKLMLLVGTHQKRPEAGRRWAMHGDALTRAAGDPSMRAIYLMSMGSLARTQGELDEARELQTTALALQQELTGPDHLSTAYTHNNLGTVLAQQGEVEQAQHHLERALAIRRRNLAPGHPVLSDTLANLGNLSAMQGEAELATRYYSEALTLRVEAFGASSPRVGRLYYNMGFSAAVDGPTEAAAEYFERALEIFETVAGAEPILAETLIQLGKVSEGLGRLDEARGHFERLLTMELERPEPQPKGLMAAHRRLGLVLLELGEIDAAVPLLEQALRLHVDHSGSPERLAEVRFGLARALVASGDSEGRRARELAELAAQRYREAGDDSIAELARVEAWLADFGPR